MSTQLKANTYEFKMVGLCSFMVELVQHTWSPVEKTLWTLTFGIANTLFESQVPSCFRYFILKYPSLINY